jgi:3-hydroxyacyl-CoA dehydrogenase
MSVVEYECVGDIGLLTLNNAPVNALSHSLRSGIVDALRMASLDQSKAIIIVGNGAMFCAGADIREFSQTPQAPSLVDVTECIENMQKPVIAAIHGNALGGGLELALACHYRCALASAKLGLPEVKLGILPGAGGTQRAPRIIGLEHAFTLITSGNPCKAEKALSIGLIDHLVEHDQDLVAAAQKYAQQVLNEGLPIRRSSQSPIDKQNIDSDWFDKKRAELSKRARGQIAPQHIVDCLEKALNAEFVEGMQFEREAFLNCVTSEQAKAMRHLFFAQRLAAKVKGVSPDTSKRPIKSVAIIGAGTMGGGIAMNFANVGIPVTLLELSAESLTKGLQLIEKNYAISVSKGRLSESQKAQRLALISGSTSYQELNQVDLVIEAVFEDVEIKKQVFRKLDEVCKVGAILATNTSYQDVDAIAQVTKRPQDVIGLHFFSPANVMKLLEVVRGAQTADDVITTSMALATTIAKIPVLSGVCYGFIGNRLLSVYLRQSQLCLLHGATPEQVDSAMTNWGAAMGPLAMNDLAGIDIGFKARQGLSDDKKGSPEVYAIADAMYHAGRLGQKTAVGYYRYDPETRARINDPDALAIIEAQSAKFGIPRNAQTEQEILNRMIIALVNEGANVLHDGIAQRSSDIDLVYIFGYGFPAYRGGPMHYADSIGTKKVFEMVCDFASKFGNTYWTPSPLLKELAEKNLSFSDWDAQQSNSK